MLSPRLFGVLCASFLLLLFGASIGSSVLVALGLTVLCMPLISFFGFYLSIRSFNSLIFERRLLKTRIVRGGFTGVRVEVSNPSESAVTVTVRDSFSTRRLKPVLGNYARKLKIEPWEKVVYSYFLRAEEEGVAQVGPASILMQDYFGFFRAEKFIEKLDRVIILPPIKEIEESVIEYGSSHDFVSLGEHTSKTTGVSTEYVSSREYVPGDDLRFVDWKATARTGKLIVKEFEAQTSSSYLIIVDCGRSMSEGGMKRKIDYLKQAVVVLTREVIKRGDEIGLLIPSVSGIAFPRGMKRYLPPDTGIDQFYSILELTSFIQASGVPDFNKAVKFIEKKIRPPLNLFLITDLEDFTEKRIYGAVERAISIGYYVTIISPYTPLFLKPEKILGEGDEFQVVVGMDIVEEDERARSEKVRRLRELGARVVEVGPTDFFPVVLTEYHLTRVKPRG